MLIFFLSAFQNQSILLIGLRVIKLFQTFCWVKRILFRREIQGSLIGYKTLRLVRRYYKTDVENYLTNHKTSFLSESLCMHKNLYFFRTRISPTEINGVYVQLWLLTDNSCIHKLISIDTKKTILVCLDSSYKTNWMAVIFEEHDALTWAHHLPGIFLQLSV